MFDRTERRDDPEGISFLKTAVPHVVVDEQTVASEAEHVVVSLDVDDIKLAVLADEEARARHRIASVWNLFVQTCSSFAARKMLIVPFTKPQASRSFVTRSCRIPDNAAATD
jgi:hypothetical protein